MSTAGFQLFPPPARQQEQSPVSPITRAESQLRKGKKASSSPISPINEPGKSNKTETVFIQIVEPNRANTPIEVPEPAIVVNTQSRIQDSNHDDEDLYEGSPVQSRAKSPENQRAPSPGKKRTPSPDKKRATSPKKTANIPQTVKTLNGTLPGPPSGPPPARRSIFPTYNPDLPLSKQKYYPARGASPTNLPSQVVQRGEYSPSVASPSRLDQIVGGPRTAPASIVEFPLDALDPLPSSFSTVEDLERLWIAANGQDDGQGSQLTLGMSFDLEMSRSEAAKFIFCASDSALPFYSLETFSNNEITTTRHHPQKQSLKVPVMNSTLESAARRRSPYDGLVTLLHPKLATMLAVDEAAELTRQNRLPPDVAEQVAADAVKRAAELEGCRLTFDDSRNLYELHIPSLKSKSKSRTLGGQPPAPTHPGTLNITVTQAPDSTSASVRGTTSSSGPTITVSNPLPLPLAAQAQLDPATNRTSTLPVSLDDDELNEPLATLDFSTNTLHISTAHITMLVPSLYAIDTIVSAMFVIAVVDNATNAVMGGLPVGVRPERKFRHRRFDSSASRLPRRSQTGASVRSVNTVATVNTIATARTHIPPKVLVTTLAERKDYDLDNEDVEEGILMQKLSKSRSTASKASRKLGRKSIAHSSPTTSPKSKSKDATKLKTKKVMVAEIDLEKYAEGGEELPKVTRGALQGMFVALRFVCWVLTVVVETIAWILVKMTRWVTREDF